MRAVLDAGLAAADPEPVTRDALASLVRRRALAPRGRLVALAAGKAAPAMARAARQALGGALDALLVVTHARSGPLPRGARLRLASHPVPDASSVAAGREVLALAESLGANDLLLVLLSGGASALLCAPAPGLRLADKQAVTRALLGCGAGIDEINVVRRHLSSIKGGGLLRAAAPARVITLALSDVLSADPAAIGSGPTAPDPSTFADARGVLARYRLLRAVPAAVRERLDAGAAGAIADTPKPGDPAFGRARFEIVGDNARSLRACAREARRRGLRVAVVGAPLAGEAREVGFGLGARLREHQAGLREPAPPCALLAGGETTVTLRGRGGRGGRNHELALGAAMALAGAPGVAVAASLATDGLDGSSGAAGARVDERTLDEAAARGLPPAEAALARSDSAPWLARVGATLRTGPTGTNVCDLVVMAALPPRTSRRPRRL